MKQIFSAILACICPFFAYGAVKIGTTLMAPPFVYADKLNGVQGYDIDLMNLVCKELRWECKFVPMERKDLFVSLQNKSIDLAMGGLIITPQRRKMYLWSLPYLPSQGGFVVMRNSPVKSISDLKGKKIGALIYKNYYLYILHHYSNMAKIIPFNKRIDLVQALSTGEIDAISTNYLTALFLQHQQDSFRALQENYNLGKGIGIAALFSNTRQIQAINQLLLKYEADGTFEKLYNYNFGFFINNSKPSSIPVIP